MTEHPLVWSSILPDGTISFFISEHKPPLVYSAIQLRLVRVDDYDEMMRAWNKCTGEQLRATIAGFTETTDDE